MRYSCHNYFGHRVGLEGMILFDTMFRTSLWTCLFIRVKTQSRSTYKHAVSSTLGGG